MDLTIDIVLCLPKSLRDGALSASHLLVDRMRAQGHPSVFQLGSAISAVEGGGICEPHVSLFMLRLEQREIIQLLAAIDRLGEYLPAVHAVGQEWRHNPQGAPELHFRHSDDWIAVQQAVVVGTEALRRGRLRDADPAGVALVDIVRRLRREDPDGQQLRQLIRYGYDEITDDTATRFNPHVTMAWPVDGFPVSLDGLSPPSSWSGVLTELAVYGMGPNGTCTHLLGSFPLNPNPNPNRTWRPLTPIIRAPGELATGVGGC